MGLFGPNWTWEEARRKDSIMRDLTKQTDRVVDAIKDSQKKTRNDEYFQKQREKTERIQARTDALNNYVNSLDDKDRYAIRRISSEAKGIDRDTLWGYMVLGRPISGWRKGYHRTSDMRFLLCIVLWIASIILLFINPLYLIITMFFIYAVYRIPLNIIPAILVSNQIKKTDCFKGLLEDLRKEDFSKVKQIGASAECIRIVFDDYRKKELKYESYNFPYLPFNRTAILLANLLRELGVHKMFNFNINSGIKDKWLYLFIFWSGDYTNCRGVHSRISLDTTMFSQSEQELGGLVVYNYSVYAINETMVKNENKQARINNKKDSLKLRQDKKNGKTW